jgi:L-lactate utilization protein LutC
MTNLTLTIVASAFAFTAPPILPFTELNDKKIEVALAHMVKANECTPQDMNVLMQLDHIHWKYAQMRQVFYKAAQEAADGSVISSKDLGKMFDKIDASLESDREKDLQRIREEIDRKENTPSIKKGKDV